MPRVTISIVAPGTDFDQEIITLDLPPNSTVSTFKDYVYAETNFAKTVQQFFFNNQLVQGDSKTLEEVGIKDGDMLGMFLSHQQQHQQQQPSGSNSMGGQRSQQRNIIDPQEIETTRTNILGNAGAINQIRQQRPALAEALNDPVRFRNVWMQMVEEDEQRERERLENVRILNDDPMNVEAQMKIEEIIRQQGVQNNLQFAYEHNPEVFARVTMLYIPTEVNKHPVKAFVDSGAQTTIMSPSCAETCGIMRLIDTRYSGIARGVGTAKILGRVHSAPIKIGNSTMSCSFTVMEGKDVDLLLGLDMLKRFQANIDLKQNKLIFGDGNEVSFLGEADIPKSFEEAQESEPTIQGPNGTAIGAQSGTVKPADSSSASGSFKGQGQTVGSSSGDMVPESTPAAAPSSSSRASGPRRTTEYPEDSIEKLESLGFSRQQAVSALDACDGNVEYAAGLLFQS